MADFVNHFLSASILDWIWLSWWFGCGDVKKLDPCRSTQTSIHAMAKSGGVVAALLDIVQRHCWFELEWQKWHNYVTNYKILCNMGKYESV